MKKYSVFLQLLLSFVFSTELKSQWILVNDTGGTVMNSAALQIDSKDQGFLMPRMTSVERMSIGSPANGLLVFQTDGTMGFYYYNGTAWDTLANTSKVNTVINLNETTTGPTNSRIATVRDVKSSGTNGGTFNSGSWVKRDLNNLSGDVSFIALNNDTMVLDSGVYFVRAYGPAYRVNNHQIRLYNSSADSVEAVGTMGRTVIATATSDLMAIVEVKTTTAKYIIEHQCENTRNNNGLGLANSWGDNVYTQVRIKKLQ